MKKALVVSAIASNQGKTLLTMALLHHFKDRVRPYKIGPDFIDPLFHKQISGVASVNLDGFMLDEKQLLWMFEHYFDKEIAICEGVMGFYDGMDKNSSAYDIAKSLQIATLLILDASGSYITISAILKGMLEFRDDNTIKGVILNKISSQMHYELVKKFITAELKGVIVLGWIEKNLNSISSRHLGLDTQELDTINLSKISDDVLKHIDLKSLEKMMEIKYKPSTFYPFKTIEKRDQKCVIVNDKNFSFVYHDNLEYLKELYKEVVVVDSTKDEMIPKDADMVVIVGGYVETQESYDRVKNSSHFKNSLINYANNNKPIYAECAGLIYLSKKIDDKIMSGILDIELKLSTKRERLGYYKAINYKTKQVQKGHAFHYSKIISAPKGDIGLYKTTPTTAKDGGYKHNNITATYLHTIWRDSFNKL